MFTNSEIPLRELAHRTNDGLDVTLSWSPRTNHVSIAVGDQRSGELFELEIPAADALDAFHHPYRYLLPDNNEHILAFEA